MASVSLDGAFFFRCCLNAFELEETLFESKECIFKTTLIVMDGSNFRLLKMNSKMH